VSEWAAGEEKLSARIRRDTEALSIRKTMQLPTEGAPRGAPRLFDWRSALQEFDGSEFFLVIMPLPSSI